MAPKENYQKNIAPFTIDTDKRELVPVKVKVSTSLMSILSISEFDHTIDLKLGITLKWYENRVLYHNLKTKDSLNVLSDLEVSSNFKKLSLPTCLLEKRFAFPLCLKIGMLWIPYIIFRNTDSDEAVTVTGDIRTLVSVTRQGDFVRSGPEVADEVVLLKCD